MTSPGDARRQEIAANLAAVRERIETTCASVGRSPDEVTLVVVTKFFPASDVALLADLGVRHVGENRHQEAEAKVGRCTADGVRGLVWHFIGGLQSNKAAAVARYADVVESVDRVKLVRPLDRGAHERGRDLDVLLQVSLDPPGASQRNGAAAEDLPKLADAVLGAEGLRLRGVMAVAPLGRPALPAFERLTVLVASVRAGAPDADIVSAGMSGDFEDAIRCGATHVRIGSAILGNRPQIK